MELHEIRYFLALSKSLNFTRAAEACNVSQPALTRAIQKMEEEFGGLLFSRERNNTHMTELGRLMEPHLREALARTQAAKETAGQFLRLSHAHLRLGVMGCIGPGRFMSSLSRFGADNPGVELSVAEHGPDQLCALLMKGDIDVALMARPDGFPPPLQPLKLYAERFVVACPTEHRLARSNVVRIAELDGECYLQRTNCEYHEHVRKLCDSRGSRITRAFGSERDDWILTMVAAGMGISFLPEFCGLVPGVVGRAMIDPAISREVCMVTVAGRRWAPPLAAFVRAVQRDRWAERDTQTSLEAA